MTAARKIFRIMRVSEQLASTMNGFGLCCSVNSSKYPLLLPCAVFLSFISQFHCNYAVGSAVDYH